jgi:hypothetical protein
LGSCAQGPNPRTWETMNPRVRVLDSTTDRPPPPLYKKRRSPASPLQIITIVRRTLSIDRIFQNPRKSPKATPTPPIPLGGIISPKIVQINPPARQRENPHAANKKWLDCKSQQGAQNALFHRNTAPPCQMVRNRLRKTRFFPGFERYALTKPLSHSPRARNWAISSRTISWART